jgi:hypothetical protein
MAKKGVVLCLPAAAAVRVRRDVDFFESDTGSLTMDIYDPPDSKSGDTLPAVVFVNGFPDPGFRRVVGCRLKEMEQYVSWGRLTASFGLRAITYATGLKPAADIGSLIQCIRRNAALLGIDKNAIGLWACSGNGPNALSVLMGEDFSFVKCAVLCYSYTLDLDGDTSIADAAKQWGFANPCSGKSVADLPRDVPLFLARAGRDETPHLNEAMDRFLYHARAAGLPVTLVNHPRAPHSFDLADDSETTRMIIRQILDFMRCHLLGDAESGFSGDFFP